MPSDRKRRQRAAHAARAAERSAARRPDAAADDVAPAPLGVPPVGVPPVRSTSAAAAAEPTTTNAADERPIGVTAVDPDHPGQDHREKHRSTHPGSENLRPPWPTGVSANPAGRPPGLSVMGRYRASLQGTTLAGQTLPDGKQLADLANEVFIKNVLKGDHRFWKLALKYTEPPPDAVTVTTVDDAETGITPDVAAAVLRAANAEPEDDPINPAE